jgi:hypothetical protein
MYEEITIMRFVSRILHESRVHLLLLETIDVYFPTPRLSQSPQGFFSPWRQQQSMMLLSQKSNKSLSLALGEKIPGAPNKTHTHVLFVMLLIHM